MSKKGLSEGKRLNDEQIAAIVEAYNNGTESEKKEAMEKMLQLTQGFIGKMVTKYFTNYKAEYYHDLYEEGVLAVIENMGGYDVTKGTLTTYFTSFILHNMSTFINDETNRSTPYYGKMMNQVKEAIKFHEERHITPSVTDISIHTGLSVKKVSETMERIEAVNEVKFETEAELESKISSSLDIKTPEQEMLDKERDEALMDALKELDEEDRQVILRRFGFLDGKEKSFGAIAKELKIPVNQVMNAVTRSLRIMSNNTKLKQLEGKAISVRKKIALNSEMSIMPDDNIISIYPDMEDDDKTNINMDIKDSISMADNAFIISFG